SFGVARNSIPPIGASAEDVIDEGLDTTDGHPSLGLSAHVVRPECHPGGNGPCRDRRPSKNQVAPRHCLHRFLRASYPHAACQCYTEDRGGNHQFFFAPRTAFTFAPSTSPNQSFGYFLRNTRPKTIGHPIAWSARVHSAGYQRGRGCLVPHSG